MLYFAKFVGAIVLFVFAFATAYFGFDMNKAREGVEQMRKEVQESQRAVEETKQSVLQIKNEAQQQLTEAQSTQSEIHKMLAQSQQESGEIHARLLELKIAPGDVSASIEVVARTFKVPEIASLYHFPSGLDGSGQTVALIELGRGYRDADLDAYFTSLHLRRTQGNPCVSRQWR